MRGPRVLYTDDLGVPTHKIVRMWMERAQRKANLAVHRGGAPAKAIQVLAGRANLTTTMRYMHLSPGAKDAAIRLLDRRPESDEGRGEVGETGAE